MKYLVTFITKKINIQNHWNFAEHFQKHLFTVFKNSTDLKNNQFFTEVTLS